MNKNNVKLTLSYDGTNYFGFQTQLSGNTIADKLSLAITKIEGEKPEMTCAGRTDTGVHAEGQVVNFFTSKINMKEENWLNAVNCLLPHDIRILKCEFVPENFNARNSAFYREYWYTLINAPSISALKNRYAFHYIYPLNIDLLQSYCPVLLGEQNFTSLSAATDVSVSKSRYVHSASIEKNGDEIIFKITANAFLHNMIRIIIGTFIKLQKENKDHTVLKRIIEAKDRNQAGPTFSSKGLVFKKVYYNEIKYY